MYFHTIDEYQGRSGQTIRLPLWKFPVYVDPDGLRQELASLRHDLIGEPPQLPMATINASNPGAHQDLLESVRAKLRFCRKRCQDGHDDWMRVTREADCSKSCMH